MTSLDEYTKPIDHMMEHRDIRDAEDALEHDVLDEFLDQRVYDAMLTTSNTAGELKQDLAAYYDDTVFGDPAILPLNSDPRSASLNDTPSIDDDYMILDPTSYMVDPHINADQFKNNFSLSLLLEQTESEVSNTQEMTQQSQHPQVDYANQLSLYEYAREELSHFTFGKVDMNMCPDSLAVPDKLYLDFSPEAMNALPYTLFVNNLPQYSRVETQIKLKLTISPTSEHVLLHIPQDLVSKNKFCMSQSISTMPQRLLQQTLFLDAFVLTSDLKQSCDICTRCIKREQKRASRRKEYGEEVELTQCKDSKAMDPWGDEGMKKKAVIFNCKELLSFPPPNGLGSLKSMELLARIICYCRHHKESEGFKILFVLNNHQGNLLAKFLSKPIMIMDRKKNASSVEIRTKKSDIKHEEMLDSIDINDLTFSQPMSPHSLDELMLVDSELRGLKRKKLSIGSAYSSNPMLATGNTYSPLSNSDTTASSNQMGVLGICTDLVQSIDNALAETNSPTILRIIPAQGPIRGGIEVTLLGFNFRPGLQVKFGAQSALATHCWSDSTIVTYLPPALDPGQVLVLFDDETLSGPRNQQIFTYTDDTDRQLIELALQIVGLKMNGKLEDAKNIAKRIVGSDTTGLQSLIKGSSVSGTIESRSPNNWFDNAHRTVQRLAQLNISPEDVLISFLSLVDLPNCPIIIPNWQLSNKQGQTILHLGTLRGYTKLIHFLINHGCKIDLLDNQGLTPLFFAGLSGHRELIQKFVERKANWNLKLSNEKLLINYCDLNVLDLFTSFRLGAISDLEVSELYSVIIKTNSFDSINSAFGNVRHASRIPHDGPNFSSHKSESEFADLEFESNDEDVRGLNDGVGQVDLSLWANEAGVEPGDLSQCQIVRAALPQNLWQKVLSAFNKDEDLPTYDDLFPLGPGLRNVKPKSIDEERINLCLRSAEVDVSEHSDSSEDLTMSFLNYPRKRVENDKMLLFFWFPTLVCILGYVFLALVMGYHFEVYELLKVYVRESLGQLMIGGERVRKFFNDTALNTLRVE